MNCSPTTLIDELFKEQQKSLAYFFERVNLDQIEAVFEACLSCQGLIILTGIGKSGIIAEKIATTFVATGTRALFLSPTNFLHGDIGIIKEEDVVLILSKSGNTEELIQLMPHIKRKRAQVISVVSTEGCYLEREADVSVFLPIDKELCPFDLAPTTSTAVQLLFGDALAIALMREKGVDLEDYAENHPAGSIGKKITLRVKDLMRKKEELPLCHAEDRLVEVIVELSEKKCGCLLIVDEEEKLEGIFTDGDLRRALQVEGSSVIEKTLGELMTRTPIIVRAHELAYHAVKKMQEKRFVMVAPVLEAGKLVGLIRMHDIIQEGI